MTTLDENYQRILRKEVIAKGIEPPNTQKPQNPLRFGGLCDFCG